MHVKVICIILNQHLEPVGSYDVIDGMLMHFRSPTTKISIEMQD